MQGTVLRTKLYIPPQRPNLIRRQHLCDRLDAGLQSGHKLTLVSAPAGFGKTTLVSHWAQQTKQPVAWLSLEESDNNLVRFLIYFVAALQTIDSNIGEGILAALQAPEAVNIEHLLIALLNETTEFAEQAILILDDYHLIDSQPIDQAVAFLLDHLSPQIHLVMLTRADPRLPLPRMRARGELLEIRAKDLRFSLDETTALLRQFLGSELTGEQIQTLQSRTEGWIAALQLAVLALQNRDDWSSAITALGSGHDYIVDYLIEEVVDNQPEELRLFLMQTAFLNRMNGSLCDTLTGRTDGETMLLSCAKNNLFITPLGGAQGWYQYHRLFADVLTNRLQQFYPDSVPALHLRAAHWFRQHDLFDEAVAHALAATDYQLVAGIVESQAQDRLHRGQLASLMGWLGALPPEIVQQHPRLSIDYAWVHLLTGKLDQVEAHLTVAEKNLQDLEDADELRGQIAAIRGYAAARLGNFDQAIIQAHRALNLLPSDDFSVRCVVAFVLGGTYHLRGDVPRALNYLEEASQLGQQAGNIHLAVAALNIIGEIMRQQGKLAEAKEIYARALRMGSNRQGQPLPITAGVFANLAELHLSKKEYAAAQELALTGLDLAQRWLSAEGQIVCCLILAQIEYHQGHQDAALAYVENAKRLAADQQLPPGRAEQITACAEMINTAPDRKAAQGLLDPLSERELEVLRLFGAGLTNQEVADELIISVGTVKAHSSSIYRKLDVRNRAQAVIRAGELNLL